MNSNTKSVILFPIIDVPNTHYVLPSELSIPNLPNRWRQNMNSVWTDHYQLINITVCLYLRGAEGWEKLQQRPLITNLPLYVKFGTKLMGVRIVMKNSTWSQLSSASSLFSLSSSVEFLFVSSSSKSRLELWWGGEYISEYSSLDSGQDSLLLPVEPSGELLWRNLRS